MDPELAGLAQDVVIDIGDVAHALGVVPGVPQHSGNLPVAPATVTSAMRGVFKTQLQTRNEFLSLVRRNGNG